MRRLQIVFHLLLIWLAFQQHHTTAYGFQSTKLDSFKISTDVYNSKRTGGIQNVSRNRKDVTGKKVRKTPSGPSPIGNQHPPSKA